MNQIEEIKQLVKQLNQCRDEYYNKNQSFLSDQEYDQLFDKLSFLERKNNFILSNSPTQQVGYEVKSKLQKVTHKTPLLSLDKTKSINELNKWKKDQYTILMLKADGLTIELEYNNGELISGSTRGNGEVGELVTFNTLQFQNVPKIISFKGYLRLSGEAIIHWNDFNEINSKIPDNEQKYKTPRNLVSGSIRQLSSEICAKRQVYFYAFDILECSEQINDLKYQNFKWLDKLGFTTIPRVWISCNETITESTIENLKNWAKDIDLPIDGEVLSFDSISYSNNLGKTNHHPLFSIAFKFEDETEESILRQVEWNTTRSGQINPTACFDAIILDNTEVSRASLFNLTFIKDMKLYIGCRIRVSKRNQIIPYVEENLDEIKGDNIKLEIPNKCPSCGEQTYIENTGTADFLFCKNPNCPAQLLDKFVHFVSRDAMNIEGLSEQTLEKFINKKFIKTFSDIYKLEQYKSQIISMEGFSIRSYNKLIEAIEKSKNVKMENFFVSLGIEGVGIGTSKLLAKKFKTLPDFINAKNADLLNINGIGDITAELICQYRLEHLNIILNLLNYVDIIKPEKNKPINIIIDNPFKGKKVYGTGTFANYKKDELKTLLESLGCEFASGYSKSLNYLIVGSVKGSGKEDKAKIDGVKILNEEEFMKMIGE